MRNQFFYYLLSIISILLSANTYAQDSPKVKITSPFESVQIIDVTPTKSNKVEVIVENHEECIGMMQKFILNNPELWYEDIGK